jgi:hypothetical protein
MCCGSPFLQLFGAKQIFIEYVNDACINEHILENLFGEKPQREEA